MDPRYRSIVDETPVPERWRPALSSVIHRLVERDYDGLVRDGLFEPGYDARPAQVARWIEEYPATLVDLPDEAWATSIWGRVVVEQDTWWVVVDLWSAEEGRSDLSLEGYVIDDGEVIRILVSNVHVM
jgi:hypothetical protein